MNERCGGEEKMRYKVITDEGLILVKQFQPLEDKRHSFVTEEEAKYSWNRTAYELTESEITAINKTYIEKAIPVV